MGIKNSFNQNANTQLVDEFIGTAYDDVKAVADSLDWLIDIANNLNGLEIIQEDLAQFFIDYADFLIKYADSNEKYDVLVAHWDILMGSDGTGTTDGVYWQTGVWKDEAEASSVKAEAWAEEAEDVEVEVGKYSSKHHSIKALGAETGALAAQAGALTSETNSATSASNASTSEVNAGTSAGNAAADAIATNQDTIDTAEDRVQTTADAVSTNNDKVAASNSAAAAAQSAIDAESYAAAVIHGLVMMGQWDASGGIAPPTPPGDPNEKSHVYRISVAGTIGTTYYGEDSEILWDVSANEWFKGGATTAAGIGLGEVDNTSDINKPVSTSTQTALNTKANTSGTYSGLRAQATTQSDVGLGSVNNTSDVNKPVSTAQALSIATKEPLISKNTGFNKTMGTGAGQVAEGNHSHTKSDIGLGNVDNTSDLAKPISVLTQTALDGKVSKAGDLTLDGDVTLKNNKAIISRNAADNGDIPLLYGSSNNEVVLGYTNATTVVRSNSTIELNLGTQTYLEVNGSGVDVTGDLTVTGDIKIGNSKALFGNSIGGTPTALAFMDGGDNVRFGSQYSASMQFDSGGSYLWRDSAQQAIASLSQTGNLGLDGSIFINNAKTIYGENAAGDANIAIASISSSDQVMFGGSTGPLMAHRSADRHLLQIGTGTKLQVDANGIDVTGNVTATEAPTAADHLTRKDYVDGNFLAQTGGVLTGTLNVTGSATPAITLSPDAAGGFPQYQLKDAAGVNRGLFFLDETTGNVSVSRNDAGGVAESLLILTDDGNVRVNGAAPTANNHLTRKDYVDDRVLNKNWVLKWTGVSSIVTNSWGEGHYLVRDTYGNVYEINISSVLVAGNFVAGTAILDGGLTRNVEYRKDTETFQGAQLSTSSNQKQLIYLNEIWKAE